jgi:hypothetical protein
LNSSASLIVTTDSLAAGSASDSVNVFWRKNSINY